MVQLADRMDGRDERTTVLITAESIIVGFLVAYAAIFNQTLVYWRQKEAPLFGTVVAALLVYALALTAFRAFGHCWTRLGRAYLQNSPSTPKRSRKID